MDKLPQIGKTYDCYDDGKIRESRRYSVKIKEIILFNQAYNNIISDWSKTIDIYHWLFARQTDYFIIADSYEQKNEITESIFARTVHGTWFSIGNFWNSGLLDVDGDMMSKI